MQHVLKSKRSYFCYKAVRVVAQVRSDNVEHSVTEATDVQDVAPFRSLRRSARLDVDAYQFRTVGVSTRQPNLILHELPPFGRDARRAGYTVRECTLDGPALAIQEVSLRFSEAR